MSAGDRVSKERIEASQNFTEPPPRFTEATLVKRMEELGIGRPSTYASTLAVLRERQYVKVEKKRPKSTPVRNPAFREHEGLRALQKKLNARPARGKK